MELRHLRYFVAVAGLLNFTKAATRLRVAQPALSRQIRDLEHELGAQLLERGPRAVRLTEAGVAFLGEAQAVLQRAEDALKAVRAVARGERGEIHVGYAPSPTVELLPCTLHAFQNLAPGVRVTLHDLSSEELLRGLQDGKLHLCLMVRPGAKSLRHLKFEVLREYPMRVAMRPTHPLARPKVVRREQLVREPLVAYARADYPEYHTMLMDYFVETGATPVIAEEHGSAPGLIAATEIGRGLAIVPASMSVLTGGRLKLRPLLPAPPPLRVGIAYDPQRLSPGAAKFLAAAHSAATDRPSPVAARISRK